MFCIHCGQQIPNDSIYCSFCGKISNQFEDTSTEKQPSSSLFHKTIYPVSVLSSIAFCIFLYTVYSYAPQNGLLTSLLYVFLAVAFFVIICNLIDYMERNKKNTSKYIKYRNIIYILSSAALVTSITLCAVHEIKRPSVLENIPTSGAVHVKASIDAKFYTTLSEGYVHDPSYYLRINDSAIWDGDVFKVSLGQKYSTEVYCSYYGSSNKSTGKGSATTQITFSQSQLEKQRATNVEIQLNSYDSAIVTFSFEWSPTFWEVIFY